MWILRIAAIGRGWRGKTYSRRVPKLDSRRVARRVKGRKCLCALVLGPKDGLAANGRTWLAITAYSRTRLGWDTRRRKHWKAPRIIEGMVMLVLSRKKNESIVINNDITIVVVEIRGDK